MFDLCSLLIAGLVIGALGRLVVPGYQPIGFLFTALLGVLGVMGGHALAKALDVGDIARWSMAIAIAAVLVAVVSGVGRWEKKRERRREPGHRYE